ncbi:hypothetical protein C5B91_05155 [Haloferax sp. Atlit-10N]|uniref:DUF7509 domain-containing protein n=1 Tax=Haloferax prahovense (strain DSM 18310 / JCM 13924 / TL6) TaxID=1227461 RepID=M0GJM4_HALPT|nr:MULTISPECIES: hypothetical protein [Haloferax]ELZ71768.1 hypothetical protein C457_06956 [Haloferax prahovense DSM 18310]RDZ45674.1 hypothetical protein C5B86_07955 [Haloferax sp. Atlit-19N]RDZ47055.1 hypothetical protein C5B87_05155 [Haloferax sp. Atlit-16N]RDZ60886.1 hypothetical protein C5B91_05155 [Haloferax sp. Atlit-10N]
MTDAISRDEIRAALGRTTYDRFLVYVMGPYKSFNLNYVLSEEELAAIDIEDLPGPIRKLFAARDEVDDALALLRRVQGSLRADPGVNAFLAVDVDLSTDEVDAATQSLAFAEASNATVFVLPFLGHNFGVGEEAGSILERLSETHGDRIVFVHEATVTSEMIRAARARWDLRVETYDTEAELRKRIRLFVADVMNRELHGDLGRLD